MSQKDFQLPQWNIYTGMYTKKGLMYPFEEVTAVFLHSFLDAKIMAS